MKPYLDLLLDVLANGELRTDRTGVGTISLFGTQTRYDLREGFPDGNEVQIAEICG